LNLNFVLLTQTLNTKLWCQETDRREDGEEKEGRMRRKIGRRKTRSGE
jgi:hypothetical protein